MCSNKNVQIFIVCLACYNATIKKKDDRGNLVILILCYVINGLFHNVFSFFDFVVIKPLSQLCVGFSFDVF